MDRILGHKPTTVPQSIVDSLAQRQGKDHSSLEKREVNKVDQTYLAKTVTPVQLPLPMTLLH